MNTNKGFAPIIAIIIAVVIIAGGIGGYLYIKNKNNSVACTQEAKQCPDGSYVGRTGSNCEFTSCPNISTSTDVTADWKTYTNNYLGLSFKYPLDYNIDESDFMPNNKGIISGKILCVGNIVVQKEDTVISLSLQADLTGANNWIGPPDNPDNTFEKGAKNSIKEPYAADGGSGGSTSAEVDSYSLITTVNGISGYKFFNKFSTEKVIPCDINKESCSYQNISGGWIKYEHKEEVVGSLYVLNVTPYISGIEKGCSYPFGPFAGLRIIGTDNTVEQKEYTRVIEGIVNSLEFQTK